MMSLRRKIAESIRLDKVGYITDDSITEIERLIDSDHGVSVLDGEYDAIILTIHDDEIKIGERIKGYVFKDKSIWSQASGDFTVTTLVNNFAIPVDGLKLAYTKRARYLVI